MRRGNRALAIGLMVVCLVFAFTLAPAGANHSTPLYLGYIGPTWGSQYPFYVPIPATTTSITVTPSDWVSGANINTVSSFHYEFNHVHTDCSGYGGCTNYDHLHRNAVGSSSNGCGQRTLTVPSGANRVYVYANLSLSCSLTGAVYGTITLDWH